MVLRRANSSLRYGQRSVFDSTSLRAFMPPVDGWQETMLQFIFNDDPSGFMAYRSGLGAFFDRNIQIDLVQHVSAYISPEFPKQLNGASIVHIAVLFSAHRILRTALKELPFVRLWSITREGITPIHVAAAIGDYLALRILLSCENPPIGNVDWMKRTALHYAAQTNIESVITLLSHDKSLLQCADKNEKTPLDFAVKDHNEVIYRFLRTHTDLLLTTDQIPFDSERKAVDMRRILEAPMILDCYICINEPKRADTICETCNRKGHSHERLSDNPVFMQVLTSRESGFIKKPTNAFGQFERTFTPFVSQFIRIADCTPMDKLNTLLFDLWQMPKPGLVLTFYGTDPFSPPLQKRVESTLGRITKQTRTWIVTDGKEKCVAGMISKAVKKYALAYGMQQLQVIGLASWHELYSSRTLQSNDHLGTVQTTFPRTPHDGQHRLQLAENHTHYIFIDCKGDSEDLPLNRSQFEVFVSKLSDYSETERDKDGENADSHGHTPAMYQQRLNSKFRPAVRATTNRVPVCGILVEGDRTSLVGISYGLMQNIPFVILPETGGLAKALEIVVKFMKQLIQNEQSGGYQLKYSNCRCSIQSLMDRARGIVTFESGDEKYLEDILERAYLLDFISPQAEGTSDMDARILRSLVKPELFEGIEEDESWDFKVRIALSLNRTDILPENMFSRVNWKEKKGMKELVTRCLTLNNTTFVSLLVDSGFPLHEYINDNLLAKLYKSDFDSNEPRVQLFRNYVRSLAPVPQLFRWSQMGQLVAKIIGFEPGLRGQKDKLANGKDIGHPVRKAVEPISRIYESRQRVQTVCLRTKYSNERAVCATERMSHLDIVQLLLSGSKYEWEIEENLLQLLIWAFLCRRFELSYLIWSLMKDSIPAALLLVCFARRMRSQQQSLREVNELNEMADFYEKSAVGILEECHVADSRSTMTMLCMKRPLYGNNSQLLLAEESNSMNFIEHQACQMCIANMWNRNLNPNIPRLLYGMSLVAGTILPPLVPFLADYNFKESSSVDTFDKTQAEKEPERRADSYKRRLVEFYRAPCVRFAYSAFCCVLVVMTYLGVLMNVKEDNGVSPLEILVHVLASLMLIEHVGKAIMQYNSVKKYFSSIWNRLVLLTAGFYVIGNLHYLDPRIEGFEVLEVLARFFLAACLLCACAFCLHFFVASPTIGPKLIMLITMLKLDVLPFLAIICVFWLTFGFFSSSMIYKPTDLVSAEYYAERIWEIIRGTYFAMFGEFDMDDRVETIAIEAEECVQYGKCIYYGATYIYPVITMVFILLTHVLSINLLIAMFTKRYDRMEEISKQLWAMQKFGLVKSFTDAPPLPFPFIIFWPFVTVFRLIRRLIRHDTDNDTPFCYEVRESQRHQIVNWQKFRSLDYLYYCGNEFKEVREKSRFGGKENTDTRLTSVNTRMTIEFLEARLQTMETRLLSAARGHRRSTVYMFKDESEESEAESKETKPPELSAGVKAVGQSILKHFDAFKTSPLSESEDYVELLCKSAFGNHKILFFREPQNAQSPYTFDVFIPWTEEMANYRPKALEVASHTWDSDESTGGASDDLERSRRRGPLLRNPTGRTGTAGHGLLPAYGPTAAIVVVLVLEERIRDSGQDPNSFNGDDDVVRKVLLRDCRQLKHQLPWFLYKYTKDCDKLECVRTLTVAYLQAVAKEAAKRDSGRSLIFQLIVDGIEKCPMRMCHMGEVEDAVNSDNAWIDVTTVGARIPAELSFCDLVPEIFRTRFSTAGWQDLSHLPPMRPSHFNCLAYFQEEYLRVQSRI